jgi:hypothetical protein
MFSSLLIRGKYSMEKRESQYVWLGTANKRFLPCKHRPQRKRIRRTSRCNSHTPSPSVIPLFLEGNLQQSDSSVNDSKRMGTHWTLTDCTSPCSVRFESLRDGPPTQAND